MFDPQTYSSRRDALIRGLASRGIREGMVLLLGSRESPMNYEANCYSFRQDSSFLYFVGIARPDLAATIDLADGGATLYGADATIDDIVWTGPLPAIAELAALSGMAASRPRPALAGGLSGKTLLYLPPYRADARAELAELTGKPYAAVNAGASLPLVKAAMALREIKSEAEIAEMDKAVAITVDMHRAALATARAGMLESDVYGRVAEVAFASGGGLAFPVIATTKGATLHTHSHDARLEAGGLFLLDAGAEAPSGYSGDLSTSFPISPRFDERQRAIYELVLRMHRKACSLLKPGLNFRDVHFAAAREGVLGLEELGLMRGDPDEAVRSGAYAFFFPCGVGHMIGLDVHDMEDYGEIHVGYEGMSRSPLFGLKSLRLAKPLKPGMTFTVEPGIYFIPELYAMWGAEGRFAGFIDYAAVKPWLGFGGIRNEEDWLVIEGGARMLGPTFDKSTAAIERARE
ncbi:MAG: aminopeptidase P family protein [Rectinemataceae bacterium]|jgi:Xaa-Pro aminopeptidase